MYRITLERVPMGIEEKKEILLVVELHGGRFPLDYRSFDGHGRLLRSREAIGNKELKDALDSIYWRWAGERR